MKGIEIIHFSFFGLQLQEPMGILFNWIFSAFCFYAYCRIDRSKNDFLRNWSNFFLVFSITTFVGSFAHGLSGYFGIYGKYPHWFGGILSSFFAGKAMLTCFESNKNKSVLNVLLYIKAVVLLLMAYYKSNFIFIAVDSIITYLFYCGTLAFIQWKKGIYWMIYFVYAVLVCLPSAFVYLLKIDLSIWFNRDDLSHLFMLGCLILFYIGTVKSSKS